LVSAARPVGDDGVEPFFAQRVGEGASGEAQRAWPDGGAADVRPCGADLDASGSRAAAAERGEVLPRWRALWRRVPFGIYSVFHGGRATAVTSLGCAGPPCNGSTPA
jgi:hypothetical protein